MKISRGLTLIELLVIIGIIGILSTVVLATVNTAKLKLECREGGEEACEGLSDRQSCSKYGDLPLKDIPARCVNYFN